MTVALKNQLLCLHPQFSGSVEDLAAKPRLKRAEATKPSAGCRVGYVDVTGVLTPEYMFGLRQRLQQLGADDPVRQIVMQVNSPGGTAEGTPELAEIVRRVAARKELHVVVTGCCCSAALWIASQATSITAEPSAIVGSVGSIFVIVDDSEFWQRLGVKVLAIATGPHKGIGIPGVKIEDENIAMLRRLAEESTRNFVAGLMRGRRLSGAAAYALATSEVWRATSAKGLGLIDHVALYEDALTEIALRTPAQQFVELSGAAALAKAQELLQVEKISAAEPMALVQMRASYPQLLERAEAHEKSELEREQRDSESKKRSYELRKKMPSVYR